MASRRAWSRSGSGSGGRNSCCSIRPATSRCWWPTASRRCRAPPSSPNISTRRCRPSTAATACCRRRSSERVEVRRLASWFNDKFHAEVSGPLVTERVFKRHMTEEQGGGPPDTEALRAARHNIRYHLAYIGWLVRTRDWLAGERLSYADLAAAAHLSAADYLGDVPWNEDEAAKNWYARVKSRPVVPAAAGRHAGGAAAVEDLRRPRLLNDPTSDQSRADRARAGARLRCRRRRPRPTPCRKRKRGSNAFSPTARTATWRGWRPTAERRGAPRALWPEVRSIIMLGMNYGPDDDPLAILQAQGPRARSRSMRKGDDYHELIKARLKDIGALARRQGRRRREGVRRYRGGDGEAARRAAPASAGRASTPIWCRANSARGCFSARSSPRSSCRPTARAGQLRQLPRLSRHLPDRGVSRALPARCAALHFLSHHRAQRTDPARAARR